MKTAKLKMWGEDYEIAFSREKYQTFDNLAIQAWCVEDGKITEPWCDVTVNLVPTADDMAYLDTNNCSKEIIDWLVQNEYVETTGNVMHSGFCKYPEAIFSEEFLDDVVVSSVM